MHSAPLFLSALAAPWLIVGSNASQAPELVPADRLILIEQFRSTGAQPFFWTTEIQNELTRNPSADGGASFRVLLTRLDAAYGADGPITFVATEGVEPLDLARAGSNQAIELPGDSPLERFQNKLLHSLSDLDGSAPVRLFDDTISAVLPPVEARVTTQSKALLIGRINTTLYWFETPEVVFTLGEAEVRMTYSGFALIDAARTQLFHSSFLQRGSVRVGEETSEISHLAMLTTTDAASEPLIPARANDELEGWVKRFDVLHHRPDVSPLRPDVAELSKLPEWATPLWLSGRLANASIGVVAEHGTNPLPLLSLGSVVLTDTALDFAGNVIWDGREVRAGRRSEIDGYDPLDGEIPSPLAIAYGAQGRTESMEQRFALFRPGQTKGAIRDRDAIIGLGFSFAAASTLISGAANSAAVGFASSTGSGTLSLGGVAGAGSSGVVGGLSATTIGLGAAGAAGVVVVASSGGGGGNNPPTPPGADTVANMTVDETFDTDQGAWVGTVDISVFNATPGQQAAASATWGASDTATIQSDGSAQLSLTLPPHQCLSGTVTLTLDGTTFKTWTNPCF